MSEKKILVSGCLFGWHCRYDDGDTPCLHPQFLKWKEEDRLIPVCPEVFGGLPTPRPDCQRTGDKVMSCVGGDCTEQYTKGANEALRLAKENDVALCINDGTFTDTIIEGQGLAVEYLRNAGYKVFSENTIEEVIKALAK